MLAAAGDTLDAGAGERAVCSCANHFAHPRIHMLGHNNRKELDNRVQMMIFFSYSPLHFPTQYGSVCVLAASNSLSHAHADESRISMCFLVDVMMVHVMASSENPAGERRQRHRHSLYAHHPVQHGLMRYFQVSQPTSTRKRSRFEYTPYKESLRRAAAGKGPRTSKNNSVLINGVSVSFSPRHSDTPACHLCAFCFTWRGRVI